MLVPLRCNRLLHREQTPCLQQALRLSHLPARRLPASTQHLNESIPRLFWAHPRPSSSLTLAGPSPSHHLIPTSLPVPFQAILDNSQSPYAQLLASSSLTKLLTEHSLRCDRQPVVIYLSLSAARVYAWGVCTSQQLHCSSSSGAKPHRPRPAAASLAACA